MTNRKDCVELGLACANVCEVLRQGLEGREPDQLSRALVKAIEELSA